MNQPCSSKDIIQLSVIVLFYHGERWIQGCIQSLQNQSLSRSAYEIILVDNGGSTPSVKHYENQPNMKVLHFTANFGFAGGNNKALAHADGELVLLMNQDVVVHYNCLEELMTEIRQNPEAGVVSANMLMITSNTHINRHAAIAKTVGLFKLSLLGYAAYDLQETDSEVIPVEFVSGNAMCFRRCVLADVENYLFDDRLKSYAEDLDFSFRLKKTKWGMVVCPKAVVYHYREQAFAGKPLDQLRKLIHVSSNRLWVYYKNLPFAKFMLKLPALLCGIPFKVARPDGARTFQPVHFIAAFIWVPFIFVYFWIRLLQSSKNVMDKSSQP